ncbi:MAG: TonB-dependent receptor, partial [Bacteroidales bacterium]|nr:TonB-dependent receptor [Bacteroidales bacterium]
ITTVYNVRQDTAFYRNVNMSHTAGFDASFMVKLPYGFSIRLSYAYVFDRQKESGVNVSYARPHTGVARFDYRFEKGWYGLGVSLSGRVLSSLNSVAAKSNVYENGKPVYEQVHYPAYTMWKLNVSQRFMDAISLNVGIDNLFNYRPPDYDLVSSTSPGITFYVSLSVDIDSFVASR